MDSQPPLQPLPEAKMTEMDLINILDNLKDDEFENFKWYLKNEKVDNIQPIKVHQLSKAERRDAVDLMVQKYEFDGAVEVMRSILKKISRNDLVKTLPKTDSGAGPGPAGTSSVPEENSGVKKLMSIRTEFIDRVSDPVLRKLLDQLLQRGVITDDEMECFRTSNRAENARKVIDAVRKKGSAASSALIAALCDVDQCLSAELQLM